MFIDYKSALLKEFELRTDSSEDELPAKRNKYSNSQFDEYILDDSNFDSDEFSGATKDFPNFKGKT